MLMDQFQLIPKIPGLLSNFFYPYIFMKKLFGKTVFFKKIGIQFIFRDHPHITSPPLGGGGVIKMMTILNKMPDFYSMKLLTRGRGVKKFQNVDGPLYIFCQNFLVSFFDFGAI